MADTRGSTSSGGGDDRGREGHDDFTGGGQYNKYHRILEAVPSPLVRRENVVHHQYPTGLIHHPSSTMPVAPCSYVPRYTMVPTSAMLPLQHHHRQLQISQENFQDRVPSNNVAAPHLPSNFQDLRPMCNGPPFMSYGQTASNRNVLYQNLTPYSFNAWASNNMPRNPVYTSYHPTAIEDPHATPFHINNHDTDQGFFTVSTSFRVDQSFVHAPSPFPPVSSSSRSFSSAQISNGPTDAKKAKKSDIKDQPIVLRRSDTESEKNDELDQTPASEPSSMSHNSANSTIRFNCREYRVILRKELTNSDVGNIGRIVMPKRDAEAHLPALHQREGVMLKMDDFKLETTWNFKYRFWPNNKSRMYVLESTGGFVKQHGLQTGDIFIIYKSSESEKLVVRGEKAIKPNVIMPIVDCSCKNDLNNSEECGFAISLLTKKT
uniref:TF-B3 domain-containing protein n=1 Tax=Oryza nivara TaxID=4536 RepID=A0A0E0H7G6_ORYNI